ncbi:MAG TPA: prepilin-type N-terminal cleavage/methylation domain-containing protein [Polyangiales bacterium]|jgi:prepilin-type N-terminal cleavage/methylation domain-containing protein|nr:prepilin-type N-terminal cleavage/methylation domain-containing protein [Polyangiales bacterium]
MRHAGFSLLEILVVLVVMSLMASAVAWNQMKSLDNSRRHETVTRARTIQSVTQAYLMESSTRRCPTIDELAKGGSLDRTTDHRDGWGGAFLIECDDDTVHVRSAGHDGVMNTEDDVGF